MEPMQDSSYTELDELVATGKTQGYLTYDQVNEYLPDEAVTPEKLDNLLIALEELGIELVNEAPEEAGGAAPPSPCCARRATKTACEDDRPQRLCRPAICPSSATIRCGCI